MTRNTLSLLVALALAACSRGDSEPTFSTESTAEAQQPAAGWHAPPPAPQRAAPPPGYAAAPPGGDLAAPPALDPQLVAPLDPSQHAPARYAVRFTTSKGAFVVDVTRAWATHGADRFYDLVRRGAYDQNAFFRVVAGFMAQVGIPGDPRVSAAWRSRMIPDDVPVEHNVRGAVTFATSGPNQRVNQFFINLVDNRRLDPMGFAPIGKVRDADLHVVDSLYAGYGEGAPAGHGPEQSRLQLEGNAYLHQSFPQMDYIYTARLEPSPRR